VGRGVEVREEDETFTVILPLLRSAAGERASRVEPPPGAP
jgi:hypothetical protein